jgi:hypothetical protein
MKNFGETFAMSTFIRFLPILTIVQHIASRIAQKRPLLQTA